MKGGRNMGSQVRRWISFFVMCIFFASISCFSFAAEDEIGYYACENGRFSLKLAENGKLVPFWMSSQLKPELTSVLVRDDGMIEASDTMGEKSLWQWITWGLERAD